MKKENTIVVFLMIGFFLSAYSQSDTLTSKKGTFNIGFGSNIFALRALTKKRALDVYIKPDEKPKKDYLNPLKFPNKFNFLLSYNTSKKYFHKVGFLQYNTIPDDESNDSQTLLKRVYYSLAYNLDTKPHKKWDLYGGLGLAHEDVKNTFLRRDADGKSTSRSGKILKAQNIVFFLPLGLKGKTNKRPFDFGAELNLFTYSFGKESWYRYSSVNLGQTWSYHSDAGSDNFKKISFTFLPQFYLNIYINLPKK